MTGLQRAGWDGMVSALVVLGQHQRLLLLDGSGIRAEWPVSTGRAGFGNRAGSGQTPAGLHRIGDRIGDAEPVTTVFRSRVAVGTWPLDDEGGCDDVITTRILWLEGLEEGLNLGAGVDTRSRYIYIHGTTDVGRLGQPASAGCIRMHPEHLVELFPQTGIGTLVMIVPPS